MKNISSVENFLNQCIGLKWQSSNLKGDSGERKYSRIQSANKSYILVQYLNEKKGFDHFIKKQALLNKIDGLYVPEIYHLDATNGYQLIQDIGCCSLEQFYQEKTSLTYHKEALNQLHTIQNTKADIDTVFSTRQSLKEMIFTLDGFKLKMQEKEYKSLLLEFEKISSHIMKSPLVLSHRDFHSRNLFIYQDKLYMIDFQDIGFYPQYYDLVSLIYDSYTELSHLKQEKLLNFYTQKYTHTLNLYTYHLTFCQRGFKAIGSFLSFYNLRKQKTHLKYIQPTLKKLQIFLESINEYPEFLNYIKRVLKEK